MRIRVLQHVPFEGLGSIERHFINKGYPVSYSRLYLNQTVPRPQEYDWLVVMGGPMGVDDEQEHPWLVKEKIGISSAIDSGKVVLGICLGAQLIAQVLGAQVRKNRRREIGWFPFHAAPQVEQTILKGIFPPGLEVFHWHGDTFSIPLGAVPLGSSKACANQGYVYQNRVVGLQFHLETTPRSAGALLENCGGELDGSEFVQDGEAIMSDQSRFAHINEVMNAMLERLEAVFLS